MSDTYPYPIVNPPHCLEDRVRVALWQYHAAKRQRDDWAGYAPADVITACDHEIRRLAGIADDLLARLARKVEPPDVGRDAEHLDDWRD